MTQTLVAPRLDVRGAEIRAVLRTVDGMLRRDAALDSDQIRKLVLNGSIDREWFQPFMLSDLAAHIGFEQGARTTACPVCGRAAVPVGNAKWQRAVKDAIEIEFTRAVHDDPSSILLQNLHAYFFADSVTDEVIETSGPYRFVRDLTRAGLSAILEGVNGSGKSDRAFWHIEQLDNLKKEEQERPRESVLYRVRQNRRWAPGPAGEEEDRKWEDERSIGLENVAQDEVRKHRRGDLDLYTAKAFSAITNVNVSPRSEHIGSIRQAFDMRAAWDALFDNEEREALSTLLIDEGGNAIQKNRQMKQDNVAIHEFYRVKRKMWTSLQIVVQDEKAQLDDEVRRGTQTRVYKKDRFSARYTVRGIFNEREFTNCSRTIIKFDSQSFSPFRMNVVPTVIFAAVADARFEHEADPANGPWTHRLEMQTMREAVRRRTSSEKDWKEGRSDYLSFLIRDKIIKYPTWPDKRISIEVTDQDRGIFADEDRVALVREQMKEDDQKARREAHEVAPFRRYSDGFLLHARLTGAAR